MTTYREFCESNASYPDRYDFIEAAALAADLTLSPLTREVTVPLGEEHDAKRLLHVQQTMERVAAENRNFDISTWYGAGINAALGYKNFREQELHACGTSACVLGWVATTEEWHQSGGTNIAGSIKFKGETMDEAMSLWLNSPTLAFSIVYASTCQRDTLANAYTDPALVTFATAMYDLLVPNPSDAAARDYCIRRMCSTGSVSIYGTNDPTASHVSDVLKEIIETKQVKYHLLNRDKSKAQIIQEMAYEMVDYAF